jgi:hypothetical protein
MLLIENKTKIKNSVKPSRTQVRYNKVVGLSRIVGPCSGTGTNMS